MSVTWEAAINHVAIGGSCYPGAREAAQRWRRHVAVADAIAGQIHELIRKVDSAGWGHAANEAFRARLGDVRAALENIANGDRGMSEVLERCSMDCAAEIENMSVPPDFVRDLEGRRSRYAQQGRVDGFADGVFVGSGHTAAEGESTTAAYVRLASRYRAVQVPADVTPRLPTLPAAQAIQDSKPWWEQLGSVAESVSKGLSGLAGPTPLYSPPPYEPPPYEPYEPAPYEPYEPPPFEPYEPLPFAEGLAGVGGGLGDGSPGTVGPATPMTTSAPPSPAAGRLTAGAGAATAPGAGGFGMYPPMMPFGARPGQQSDERGSLIDDSGTFDPCDAPSGLLE
jgi:hypothetical protein